jgi:phosphoenolpyruvate carboxykinase (ATP)
MQSIGLSSLFGLENHGLQNLKTVYWNLIPAELIEQSILRAEGHLALSGALVVETGKHTGRSPSDKFINQSSELNGDEIWWGKINQPLAPEKFQLIYQKMRSYMQGRDVFVQDMQIGAHPSYRLPVRIISEKAWASLFAYNLFRRLPRRELRHCVPEFTVLHCPDFYASPHEDGVRSNTVIAFDFSRKLILIGGTSYAGEVKKAIFSVMNYLLPRQQVLSMHCSANVGKHGDVALFFGLSGTGKTTLSSDPERRLIGDDEHGWSDEGVFNFEGGCYAKTIRLSNKLEPLIWQAVNRFGSVLENVIYTHETRRPDFDDARLTENTRAAYPIDFIPNYLPDGYGGHPENIFFLTADAFGVMPPIARLTPEQAMYYFLSGYTSKLAGTEKGLGSEPEATFSACFGAPFLPLHPHIYADLLGEKIAQHQVKVWLINTGWTGGPYGVGHRILLAYTRAMVRAVLSHQLANVNFTQDPCFGLWIPDTCPGVTKDILTPIKTWTDTDAYLRQAKLLVERFQQNFAQFTSSVSPSVVKAGPQANQH